MIIPSPSPSTMKTPKACSIPHLLEINPFEEFEFSFPSDELWWDDHDVTTSDYFSDDDEDYSATTAPAMIDISFQSTIYTLSSISEDKEEDEDDNEKDVLIQKIISTITHVSPTSVYKRQRAAMKRRRCRRKRKKIKAALIEPELRLLWHNSVGDLFAPSASEPSPPLSLPKINLSTVNKSMLNRLPDVIKAPIHSCSEDEKFYTKVVCQFYATKYVQTPTPQTQHQVPNPFGSLPGIETDLGIIPPPTEAIYGYVYSDGKWRVKAENPSVPDPGGGRGRGRGEEDRGGRGVREAGQKGWRQKMCVRDI